MAFSINTNTAALEALASLRSTNAMLTTAENTVSTGKKVNTAADDPAIYAISQSMNSQISALAGISTGLQVTAQVISTAQSQAASSSTLLASLSQSLTEGQTKGLDPSTLNQTIAKTLSQIDANANGATFKGVNLLAGTIGNGVVSTSASAVQDLSGTLFQQGGSNATSAGLGLQGLQVNQAGVQIALGATPTLVEDGSASTITLANTAFAGTTTASGQNVANQVTFTLTDSVASQQTAVTSFATANSTILSGLTLNTDGSLSQSGIATTGTYAVSSAKDGSGNTVFTLSDSAVPPALPKATLTQSKDTDGNYVYTLATSFDANNNATNETTLVTVDTSQATDSTSKVNDLTSAVTNQGFGISKDASNTLSVAGGNLYTGTATGVATGGTSVTQQAGSTFALLAVNAAIGQLNKISSSLGSSADELTGLQSTVSSLSDALTSGVGALTDADLSAESAKLTSLQTKQQLAIQSLSIANSQPQSLLSLFR